MRRLDVSFHLGPKSLDIVSESTPTGNKLKVFIISELSLCLFFNTFKDIFIATSTTGFTPWFSSYFYFGNKLVKLGFIISSYS